MRPLTDDEDVADLRTLLDRVPDAAWLIDPGTLCHALQAIADRAALCDREVSPLTWPDLHAQIVLARRHMRGEAT